MTTKKKSAAPVPIDPNELLRRIVAATATGPDEIPPGWMTVEEYADLWKLSYPRTNEILRSGLKAGIMQRRKLRTEDRRLQYYYAEAEPDSGR